MRLSTSIIATSALVILTTASAEDPPIDPIVASCGPCINIAMIAAVPLCNKVGGGYNSVSGNGKPSAEQAACFCGVAANKTWANSCVDSGKCTKQMADGYYQLFTTLTTAKSDTCNGGASSAAVGSRSMLLVGGSSSSRIVAGAAVAIAGPFL
ncbi:MAG: hypothetical protein J3R72DRAFT_450909 [Linnemannia gamsii]|nr:MAG: hypothetical protein J3R72DRAFT_450909 [Linnemannia gamsii]